jgi:hypothetical protein
MDAMLQRFSAKTEKNIPKIIPGSTMGATSICDAMRAGAKATPKSA